MWVIIEHDLDNLSVPRVASYSGFEGGDIYVKLADAQFDCTDLQSTNLRYGDGRAIFKVAELAGG